MKNITYIYSNQCEVATYLEFLIDKVRKIPSINFIPVCIEENKKTAKAIQKVEEKLEELVKKQDYEKAADERANLTRCKLSQKYENLSPIFIFDEGTEHEFMISGSKSSLATLLDYGTKVTDFTSFLERADFSGFDTAAKLIINTAIDAVNKNNAGEGLETTQKQPQ